MTQAHMLPVFVDANGNFGDTASVVVDEGRHINDEQRQILAKELNTGETVFINDISAANISIMHPQGEINFAGVPALGAVYLLAKLRGKPAESMQGRGGAITAWQDGDLTWVRAELTTMPPWNYKHLESSKAVEEIKIEDMASTEHTMIWAWVDEDKSLIRARTFATDWEIPEAEGNGSGALVLASRLGRDIEVRHGKGSIIFAKPAVNNCADIGGRVIEENEHP